MYENNVQQQQQQTNFIENWKITNYITFPPANSLWTNRGGGSWRHITKQDLYIDGLNNSEDTTIQLIIIINSHSKMPQST